MTQIRFPRKKESHWAGRLLTGRNIARAVTFVSFAACLASFSGAMVSAIPAQDPSIYGYHPGSLGWAIAAGVSLVVCVVSGMFYYGDEDKSGKTSASRPKNKGEPRFPRPKGPN